MERWLNRNSSSLLLPVRPTQKVISSFSDCVLGCAEVFKLSMHHLSSSCLHHKKKRGVDRRYHSPFSWGDTLNRNGEVIFLWSQFMLQPEVQLLKNILGNDNN
ncbi:uncharacterized protein LOC118145584 isoform X1 [Callithrix jacchus]